MLIIHFCSNLSDKRQMCMLMIELKKCISLSITDIKKSRQFAIMLVSALNDFSSNYGLNTVVIDLY